MLSSSELTQFFSLSHPGIKPKDAEKLSFLVKGGVVDRCSDDDVVTIDNRMPIVLCLDKVSQHQISILLTYWRTLFIVVGLVQDAHALCWEGMPLLSGQMVSRMPSVYAVQSYLKAFAQQSGHVYNKGVDVTKGYYIVNPANNLASTEKLFKPILTA